MNMNSALNRIYMVSSTRAQSAEPHAHTEDHRAADHNGTTGSIGSGGHPYNGAACPLKVAEADRDRLAVA